DGAAKGAGLGHRFLKHLSRCAVLVHILDPLRLDPENPVKDLDQIIKELRAFDKDLVKKPKIIAVSKMDLAEGQLTLNALKKAKPRTKILAFSSATGEGLLPLKREIWAYVEKHRLALTNSKKN
ncbi:MAG: GTPase ObgE, partial [Candidatus Adiutrix sp.]